MLQHTSVLPEDIQPVFTAHRQDIRYLTYTSYTEEKVVFILKCTTCQFALKNM